MSGCLSFNGHCSSIQQLVRHGWKSYYANLLNSSLKIYKNAKLGIVVSSSGNMRAFFSTSPAMFRNERTSGLWIRRLWRIAALGVLQLRKIHLLMVRAGFLLFSHAFASRKIHWQEHYVAQVCSQVTISSHAISFLFFSFGWFPSCWSIFKWFYRPCTAGDFRVAPLLLFLNNLSVFVQYYHAEDSLLWYCVWSRTILHTPSLSKINHAEWAQWHHHQMIN